MKNILLTNLLLFCYFLNTQAQDDGYFISLGINACDVTGDAYYTYQKPGLVSGLGLYRQVYQKQKIHYRFGVFYSQKGSRKAPDPKNNDPNEYRLSLHYIEMPLQFDFDVKQGIFASVGTSAGYLLRYSEKDQSGREMNASVGFKKLEWSGLVSGGISLGKNGKIEFGYAFSVLRIRSTLNLSNWYYSRGAHNSLFFLKLTFVGYKKREIINNVDEN